MRQSPRLLLSGCLKKSSSRNSAIRFLHARLCWGLCFFWHSTLQYRRDLQAAHVFNFISSISAMPQEAQTSAVSPSSPLIISTCPSFLLWCRSECFPANKQQAGSKRERAASLWLFSSVFVEVVFFWRFLPSRLYWIGMKWLIQHGCSTRYKVRFPTWWIFVPIRGVGYLVIICPYCLSHSVQQDRGRPLHSIQCIRLHEAIHTSLLRHPKESIG